MKIAKRKPTVHKLRSWRVILIRSKGEYLGSNRSARGPKL
jgi:hypothetical protein